jgi:hypothetical protein
MVERLGRLAQAVDQPHRSGAAAASRRTRTRKPRRETGAAADQYDLETSPETPAREYTAVMARTYAPAVKSSSFVSRVASSPTSVSAAAPVR